jgi:DNA-binding winged helix-turn-helix (wHTH) protein
MALLVALIRHPGVVKSRNSLIDEAYAENIHVDERTIDSHMKRIRAKLRELDPDFDGIQSVYGIGYRFRVHQKNAMDAAKSAIMKPHPISIRHDSTRSRDVAYATLACAG